MDISVLKQKRKGLRTSFTTNAKKIQEEIEKEEWNLEVLIPLRKQLDDKYSRLENVQEQISDLILKEVKLEVKFEDDFLEAEVYRDRYLELISRIDEKSEGNVSFSQNEKRNFKLPRIELKKFDGDPKNFLTFWAQFKKIHEDETIAAEDKMQYLLQSMEPKTKAERLLLSFPATAENYPKAIEQMKERFGREDLLVQIYVRELLTLVMRNASSGRAKVDLTKLYDELEGKLRALESLGRTQEKYGDFLIPLVESCLPEEVLLTWERSRTRSTAEEKNSRTLEELMNFLRQEVRGEEMVNLSRTGFASNQNFISKDKSKFVPRTNLSTASALVSLEHSGKQQKLCVFCEGNHLSNKCFSARKMSLDSKKLLLKKKGVCFCCLVPNHISKFCEMKNHIKCSVCSRSHFELMCDKKLDQSNEKVSLSNSGRGKTVYLQTLFVKIRGYKKEKKYRSLIDSASQSSYISEKAIKELSLKPIRYETVIHSLFGGVETKPKQHDIYSIEMRDLKGNFSRCFEIMSETKICNYVPRIVDPQILNELKNKQIELSDLSGEGAEIDILIGADILPQLMSTKSINLDSGLIGVETKLGWCVMGKPNETCTEINSLSTLAMHVSNISLSNFWELEILGIDHPEKVENAKATYDERLNDFKENLKILPDGRYELELPFKDSQNLPDNKQLTLKRHEKMMQKLKCNNFLDDYRKVFDEWESLNIIERVPKTELGGKCHYLPHRPVIKMSSQTSKIRPVFDASACERGRLSLNECLFKGVNLISLIPDIIDRFRMYPVGLSADVEKAFLMMSVAPKHRDFLRFFYPCNDVESICRHCRVVFGVSSSPFLLNATIMHLLDNCTEFLDVVERLKCSFYVDNCLTGVHNVTEAENFIEKAELIMSKGCFNLRGWESNVECKHTSKNSGNTSILGLIWNLDEDSLMCKIDFEILSCRAQITKRFILSTVQKFYDPLGMLTPSTLLPKLILQDLWKSKFSWDEKLPVSIVDMFSKWLNEMHLLKDVNLPRFMNFNETSELHVFVDACKGAYAACVFVRSKEKGEIKVRLIRAKSRVAPLKSLSIPRLELMACCIGARLVDSIIKALDTPSIKVTLWSDSTVALWWIKEHGEWSVFVANRVKEITKLTGCHSWRHVPGNLNVADLLSRGCTPQQMLNSKWWEGPSWLRENLDSWPVSEIFCPSDEVDIERRKSKLVNVNLTEDTTPWYAERVSNYDKMINVLAWVLRFVNNCKKNCKSCKDPTLSLNEIENTERTLILLIQNDYFSDLKNLNNVETFRDEKGVLRVKTKIIQREDDQAFLTPILLPGKCRFTVLLIESVHKKNCHSGIQMLQSILRERFWIMSFRKTIRSVLNQCMKCKRFKVKSMLNEPPPLPSDRVSDCLVFQITGVDLAGPLILKSGEKVWIVLFTCAVYRAIHLELVRYLSTDSFLLSLRRFIARRGRPSTIYSDNGSNFRGSYNEFSRLDWEKIVKESKLQRIFWKFIPPTSAWWGGWWERLVRSIKELLRRTLGKSVLTYEELETVVCDCESIINSRPLTYISENPEELIPLTPSMFLVENRCFGVEDVDKIDSQHLQKRIRYRAKLFNDLRQRFRKEYIGQLIQKRNEKKITREPKVGEVVLIGEDTKKRLDWPLALVIELIPGSDNKVRTVKLKTAHGTILRSVQRIFPLEIQSTENLERSEEKSIPDSIVNVSPDEVILKRYTSSGRYVKTPKRLDLLNQICYEFESLHQDSMVGRMLQTEAK